VGLTNLGSESETCVGSRVRLVGVCISLEKNFYRLPFTPPLSGSPYRSFTYKLELPDHAKIHPVVHVSQLKKHISAPELISTDLSAVCVEAPTPAVPVAIIQQAYKRCGGKTAMHTLVQWDSPVKLHTWEDEQDLRRRFPAAPAWGQAVSEAGGLS
jgi:hypothetical protein